MNASVITSRALFFSIFGCVCASVYLTHIRGQNEIKTRILWHEYYKFWRNRTVVIRRYTFCCRVVWKCLLTELEPITLDCREQSRVVTSIVKTCPWSARDVTWVVARMNHVSLRQYNQPKWEIILVTSSRLLFSYQLMLWVLQWSKNVNRCIYWYNW